MRSFWLVVLLIGAGSVTFEDVARWAEASKGGDPNGYRSEFVKLVRAAQQSAPRTTR